MTTTVTCGRLDTHPAHEWIRRTLTDGYRLPWNVVITDCPGAPVIEGGALDLHDCGEKAHPAEIRRCCRRCETTICPNCGPCRRVT